MDSCAKELRQAMAGLEWSEYWREVDSCTRIERKMAAVIEGDFDVPVRAGSYAVENKHMASPVR
jgi:hypothetical protein